MAKNARKERQAMGREGYLGEFEQMLLLAAMRLEDEAYGVALMQELESRG